MLVGAKRSVHQQSHSFMIGNISHLGQLLVVEAIEMM